MHSVTKRLVVLAVLGVVVIGGVYLLRASGMFKTARERADTEFALSERAHHNGDFEAAMRHMQNAVRLDPRFVQAREGLAAMYEQHRGLDSAIAEYERGIKEDPKNEARYCYRIAEVYFVNRRWESALEWLKRADGLQPNDFHVERMTGFCLERLGRWKEAEQHWSRLLEKDAKDTNIQRALARVRRHLNHAKDSGIKGE